MPPFDAFYYILSCSVCSATVPDVYRDPPVYGLRDGDGSKGEEASFEVAKLYMLSCMHICCLSHFENGAIDFHSKEKGASAPCPVCMKESGDHALKELKRISRDARERYKKGDSSLRAICSMPQGVLNDDTAMVRSSKRIRSSCPSNTLAVSILATSPILQRSDESSARNGWPSRCNSQEQQTAGTVSAKNRDVWTHTDSY